MLAVRRRASELGDCMGVAPLGGDPRDNPNSQLQPGARITPLNGASGHLLADAGGCRCHAALVARRLRTAPVSRNGERARHECARGARSPFRIAQRRGKVLEAAVHALDHSPRPATVADGLAAPDRFARGVLQRDTGQPQVADRLFDASQKRRRCVDRPGVASQNADRGRRLDELAAAVVELVVGLATISRSGGGTHALDCVRRLACLP